MPTVNVTIRMDPAIKKQAEQLFDDLGLSLSSAINMFIRQSVRDQGIPFNIAKKSEFEYMNRKDLDKLADKVYKEHPDIYKELAK